MISEEVKGQSIISVNFNNSQPKSLPAWGFINWPPTKSLYKKITILFNCWIMVSVLLRLRLVQRLWWIIQTHSLTFMNECEEKEKSVKILMLTFSLCYSGEGVISCVSEELVGGESSLTWIWFHSNEAGPSTHSTSNKWWVHTHTHTVQTITICSSAFPVWNKIMDSTLKCQVSAWTSAKHPHRKTWGTYSLEFRGSGVIGQHNS